MSETIHLFDVKSDDMVDYKKTSLLLAFPCCFKNCEDCQNKHLRTQEVIEYSVSSIVNYYNRLSEHQAIVCAGLDPIDSLPELEIILKTLLNNNKSVDFVIYTGYKKDEIGLYVLPYLLSCFEKYGKETDKLIFKFGEYNKNNKNSYFSKILGVNLVGDNQVAEQYELVKGKAVLTKKDYSANIKEE